MNALEILFRYKEQLLYGLRTTIMLCAIIWPAGIVFGALIGIAGARWRRTIGWPSRGASFVLSGIPILVFLFWLHYPVQYALHVVIDPFYTAVVALSIVNTFLVADLVRGVLVDFPTQYLEAAWVCGLTPRQTVTRVQFPIISRQILPSLLSIQVGMLQATLFASLISVDEIFRIAQRINSEVYRPVEIYTALAVLFLAVCLPLHGLSLWLRVRFTRNLSEK